MKRGSGRTYRNLGVLASLTSIKDHDELVQIWQIAALFRDYPDGSWTRETCIKALTEIADLSERLGEDLFGDDPFTDTLAADPDRYEVMRRPYKPYLD